MPLRNIRDLYGNIYIDVSIGYDPKKQYMPAGREWETTLVKLDLQHRWRQVSLNAVKFGLVNLFIFVNMYVR